MKAVVTAVCLLVVACSSQRKPGERRVAVIAVGNDPGHFNPGITTAAHVHAVADSLFNGLVALDEERNPLPDLATRWEIKDEARTYVFHLASGVRWHDGAPFGSKDVAFTFEHVLLRFHSRTRAGLAGNLESIDTPDDRTVIFRFAEPYAPLLQRLDVTEAPILPAHRYADGDVERHPANLAPVGTGPFRFSSHQPDDRIVLVRNDDYFKPGLPRLDELVFRIIPDESTQLLALRNGEVDYVGSVRPSDVKRLRASLGGFTVVGAASGPGGSNCVMTWIFNLERRPLDDVRVRHAFAHAIDRGQIVERVLFGEGDVPSAPIARGIPWAQAEGMLQRYDLDPARAEGLFREAGWHERSIDIVLFPTFIKYGEILQQQLAEVGVTLEIRALDRAAAVETVYTDRDFDTALVSYCQGVDPDIGVRRLYDSSSIGPVPFSNAAAYRNAEVDALFERAAKRQDRAERGALYHRVQEIVSEDLPYWWLVETRNLTAYRSAFRDFAPWSGQFAERARSATVSSDP
ncbi:MAG TPA: ABC transporter substrate-binding protein [Vicinamibacteria bacterium]|nr:ABC transporter substrate-binding protein [Vicinamibacteria bacterium]